jgi:hypothetical protein
MKEFEKWWKAYAFNRLLLPDNCAKAGWKAALEFVMNSDPPEGTVWDMIEKELEE